MIKILRYSFLEMIRNRWLFIYMGFFLLVSTLLLEFSGDVSKVIISLLNIILVLVPLISLIIGIIYYYNSRDFIELLLAQPISRASTLGGIYFGMALSLVISLCLGLGIPFMYHGIFSTDQWPMFLALLGMGLALSLIFSILAFLIAIRNENRIKGFGLAILLWLFFAILYDGVFLLILLLYKEYPLESFTVAATMINPIDLARIFIIMKLDISALMGYTGAVFQKFFSLSSGLLLINTTLFVWFIVPFLLYIRSAKKKDW